MESGPLAHRLIPPHVETLYPRRRRSDTKIVEECLDGSPVTFHQHLNRPIIEVPDSSLQPLLQRGALRERPIGDALHTAHYQNPPPGEVAAVIERSHMMRRTSSVAIWRMRLKNRMNV
jgi:hypothetical protein